MTMATTERPVAHANIQIGDRVEIRPVDRHDAGLPVYGRVVAWTMRGNLYTIDGEDGQPRRVAGSRLHKCR